MKPILPNKLYNVLKWLLLIVVPAFCALFTYLANTWEWDVPVDAITGTISAVAAFLGIITGISQYNYNKTVKEDIPHTEGMGKDEV